MHQRVPSQIPRVYKGLANHFLSALVIFLTPYGVAQAANLCSKIHQPRTQVNAYQKSLSLREVIQARYFTKEQTGPVRDFDGNVRHMVSHFYFRPLGPTDLHTVMSYKLQKGSVPLAGRSDNDSFQNIVKESIEFVLGSYAERRIWSAEFRDHLYQQAIQDSSRSMYIQFRVLDPNELPEALKGTLKIITASSEKKDALPVDANLGIQLPFNGGLKFELGNFAIDKKYNKEAFSEILIQLMLHAQEVAERPNHVSGQMIYFTYADAFSYRMYRSLGFTPVPGFENPIEKDGTKWTPMGISAEGILEIPQTMLTSRSYWEPQVLKEILDVFSNIDFYNKQRIGTSFWSLPNFRILLSTMVEQNAPAGGGDQARQLEIDEDGARNALAKIPIPFSFLPMKENSVLSNIKGIYHLHYQDGFLKIEISEGGTKKKLQIKVDPNFSSVESIQILN